MRVPSVGYHLLLCGFLLPGEERDSLADLNLTRQSQSSAVSSERMRILSVMWLDHNVVMQMLLMLYAVDGEVSYTCIYHLRSGVVHCIFYLNTDNCEAAGGSQHSHNGEGVTCWPRWETVGAGMS